ncbi:bifunctional glycosyl transferase/transpeptidase [Pantoea sp. Mhis]|uniref:bifunctional glycosyl transferase/transpeptidase n=1 Tax=Pantoea sp. Mhis TaxID=2576759 RepID=UPI00135B400C|nr:bifunctional glycosyl transferase/transpeptidase [Pantoea sp. Mhis]MXP56344.1 bifunctional glycosyl transferase/transpeptidase [Pantoea sp. Mhis]
MLWNNREPIGRKKRQTKTVHHNIKRSSYKLNNKYILIKRLLYNGKYHYLGYLTIISLILIITILIWGIYLYSEICTRIDGKVWKFPVLVYGRIVDFEPGMLYTQNQVIKLLEVAQYRKVLYINHTGEFSIKDNTIDILRRAFNFPDSKEWQFHVRMTFNKNEITEIKNLDTGRNLGFFRLDPRLISMLQSPNGEQRLFVPLTGFPNLLINMLIDTEDRYFYRHGGINLYSIGRAILANIHAGRTVQGGSTLTQQLVKNLFLTNKRSLWRKVREVYMALIMDARYSKNHILELYLNEVYLGQIGNEQIHGFPLASLYYFGCPVDELSLDQQATLVGMVKGASLYNPWHSLKLAIQRRNVVLHLLQHQKIIDQKLYDVLSVRGLSVQKKGGVIIPQPAFIQFMRNEIQNKIGNNIEDLSGAKIFTTLDLNTQKLADRAVQKEIPILKKKHALKDLEIAMVVVDRFSGEIRAIIGGSEPQFAGYNRALQARRSIGSLAKPTTYLTALSQPNSYRLNSWIADTPIALKQSHSNVWKPMNNDHHYTDKVLLGDALIYSMNIPTVHLGMVLGLESVAKTWIKLGVPKNQLHLVPSILLGALNLTPIEVAQVFQSISSGGNYAKLSSVRAIIAENGTILYQSYPQAEYVVAPQAAYLTMYAMQQVVSHGTAHILGRRYPKAHLAGKTGTTNDLVDSWFAGIDGKEVVITWVGRDNNQSSKLYGATGALHVYIRYLENQAPTPLELILPEDISYFNIDSIGNFVCNKTLRTLPVWTLNPDKLCENPKKITE